MNDFSIILRRFEANARRLPLACKIGMVLVALAICDNIAFLVWRWDKPYNNPGGPLLSMGPWALFWEISCSILRLIGMLCIIISTAIAGYRREQLEKRSDHVEPSSR